MLVLSLDTSTALGGVALLRDQKRLSSATWQREGSHGEHLTPHIEKCLQESKLSINDIEAIILGHGPGSFTGVRIAVNAARSLSFVKKIPVYVFDTTEILASQVKNQNLPVLTLLNAHKNLLFSSTFKFDDSTNRWQRALPLAARSIDEIASLIKDPHLCVGDGFEEYENVFTEEFRSLLKRDEANVDYPDPVELGLLFWRSNGKIQPLAWNEVQALYIRASGAEEKLRESLTKSPKAD